MISLKNLLIAVLVLSTIPLASGKDDIQGVVIPEYVAKKSKKQVASQVPVVHEQLEVELIRLRDPSGNEIQISLSEEVMGRKLKPMEYEIPGVDQPLNSPMCQKTVSSANELKRAELRLELEMLIEELSSQPAPRELSEVQRDVVRGVPKCEMFRLHLAALSKILNGYEYQGLASTKVNK